MKIILFLLTSVCWGVLTAQIDYSDYNELLKNNVSTQGKVNYKALKQKKEELNAIVGQLNKYFSVHLSKNVKLAYWINVYNANTLLLITDHYPLKSILDLDNGKTWDVKRIKIGMNTYSLNQIENEILRKEFKDARIHFALNCAAASCPPLLNKIYDPVDIESQLDQQTKLFLNSTVKSIAPNQIEISKLFEWYAGDFGDIILFVNKYSDLKFPDKTTFIYSAYNWKLNE